MKLPFVLALDHNGREVWRYYRAAVRLLGPCHLETLKIRKNLRVMLQNYTRTSVRLDEDRYVLGHA